MSHELAPAGRRRLEVAGSEKIATALRSARTVAVLADRSPGADTIDARVRLRPDLTLTEAHRISHEIADEVLAGAPEVADVLIHPEPAEVP